MIKKTAEDCARIAEEIPDVHGIGSAIAARIRAAYGLTEEEERYTVPGLTESPWDPRNYDA